MGSRWRSIDISWKGTDLSGRDGDCERRRQAVRCAARTCGNHPQGIERKIDGDIELFGFVPFQVETTLGM